MLERLVASHRSRLRRGPAIALSITAHITALSAFLVHAAWRVDRIESPDRPILVAASFVPSPAMVEGPRRPDPPKVAAERPRKLVDVPQLITTPTTPPAGAGRRDGPPGPADGATCPAGSVCTDGPPIDPPAPICGNGILEEGEDCDDGGTADGDRCTASCRNPPPKIVQAGLIEGQRIAGNPQIPPPESVRSQMMRSGKRAAVGAIKMCLDKDGRVRSLGVLRSTGYAAYDQLLVSRMEEWRYRPFRTGSGDPIPVCTAVTFIYRMQ